MLALYATPDDLLDQGLQAFRTRKFATAEGAFRQVIAEQPSNARAYKLLGLTFAAQEKYGSADQFFRRACALDPKEPNACYYLGRTLYTLSRLDEAREAFEQALRNAAARGRPLHGLALTFEAMHNLAEAERYYREAIAVGEKQARVDYGLFLFKTGRGSDSLRVLRDAGALEEFARVEKALRDAPAAGHTRSEPPPIRFESNTLDMVVRNGAAGEKHLIESVLGGIAVFDYDNDGWPDIYVANGAALPTLEKTHSSYFNRLFRNNHDGTFTDVTKPAGVLGEGYAMGVAAADYDNDGCVDLFVAGVRGNILFRNRCDGTFENVTVRAGVRGDGAWSVAAGWLDYDNDGLLDLFVVRYVMWDPATEIHCGKPGIRTYCHPSNYKPLANALYHNEGNGRFRDVSVESGIASHRGKGMSVAFGDYDGDDRLDIFVTNDTMPNFLFHNEGNGKFRESAVRTGVAYDDNGKAASAMGVDFRDYDNDGREDLFVTALSNERFLLFRNLGGRFSDMAGLSRIAIASMPWTGWSTGMFDLNNDGFKDIFVASGHVMDNAELTSGRKSRQPNLVFTNRGDGTFEAASLPGEAFHRAAAFGDFDRDGRTDVVVSRLNDKPILLHNISPVAQHWIGLELVGTRSNRDAIGARVHIVTNDGEQWNRVTTAVGYGSASERPVHFGLGNSPIVNSIKIEWPSGKKQHLSNVTADRYVRVWEQ